MLSTCSANMILGFAGNLGKWFLKSGFTMFNLLCMLLFAFYLQ